MNSVIQTYKWTFFFYRATCTLGHPSRGDVFIKLNTTSEPLNVNIKDLNILYP